MKNKSYAESRSLDEDIKKYIDTAIDASIEKWMLRSRVENIQRYDDFALCPKCEKYLMDDFMMLNYRMCFECYFEIFHDFPDTNTYMSPEERETHDESFIN